MARRLKVTAIKRKKPDEHLYVLALITFARELAEEQKGSTSDKDKEQ